MAKRKTKVLYKNVTQAQFEEAMAAYATANAKAENVTSKMDVQISRIREKYADQLTELAEAQEENYSLVMSYCEDHPEFFEKKKSMETVHGKVGFRTGTPKLKLKKGTWAKAMEAIKKHLPTYIRTKEEPAKDTLLADRDHDGMDKKFAACGLYVDNDERFFIDLKKEEAEAAA